tara:strand:+ start:265 stop:444 length:180 start_codon:yes stop_codon:yes gene_type:complete
MDDIDIKSTKDNLISQLEEAKKQGTIEKAEPKYIKKKSTLDKLNKFMKNKVYGETDLLK